MVRFIPAEQLKSRYDIFGHFYDVEVSRRIQIACRSVLEIVAQSETPPKLSAISEHRPDAVFIMMNPGSSQPLVPVDNRIRAAAIHELPISLVPTRPDTTQYQVMRVMACCGWKHVRVLNLSDLRCARSPEFFRQFKQLEQTAAFDSHSIFSGRRSGELYAKLTQDTAIPVIRAWGVSPELDPLIERCTAILDTRRLVRGLQKAGTTNKFLHPLPSLQKQKLVWVNRMVQQCRE